LHIIGQRIRRERKKQQLTLQKLSNKSGLAISSLCDIEKGRFTPSLESLYKIAGALGVKITFFYLRITKIA